MSIPDGVTNIGAAAFFGCPALTSITIGENVKMYENESFYNGFTTYYILNGSEAGVYTRSDGKWIWAAE